MIRTPREWDETCTHCRGTGTVHKRECFALWTPEEYAAVMPPEFAQIRLDPKHNAPSDAYVCVATGGCTIFEACREGVEIARAVGRPVAFEFNGAVAICRTDSDPAAIAKAWWRRAYGETYEEAMKRR